MIPLTAALAVEDGGAPGPLVDWLGWAATDREVRRWIRDERAPDGMFARSLREDARDWASRLDRPTVYAVEAELEPGPSFDLLVFREAIVFTNRGDEPMANLHVRVFANTVNPQFGVHVGGVWMSGLPVNYTFDGALLTVRFPRPLPPGGSARLLIQAIDPVLPFDPTARVLTPGWWPNDSGVLGTADGQTALGLFLPTVTATGGGGQDERGVSPNELPSVYDPALWHVSFTHPVREALASTGVVIASTADGRAQTEVVVAGGARDFAIQLVPDAAVEAVDVGGTRLRVIWRSDGDPGIGADLLGIGRGVLETYTARFGPPLDAELDIVEGPIRGLQALDYPGLVVLDTRHQHRPYHRSARHEWALAHGIAHQWWGHEVGSDGLAEPWVDEGLAEHAAGLYWEERYGHDALVARHQVEVLEPLGALVATGQGLQPGNLPADQYPLRTYPILVDGRAAMFFDGLRRSFGDEAWTAALRALRAGGAGRRLTGAEVLEVLGRHAPAGTDLSAVFLEQMVSDGFVEDLLSPP